MEYFYRVFSKKLKWINMTKGIVFTKPNKRFKLKMATDNKTHDCLFKDDEEEEERPLCRNCEIETRKHCDDCGGYGSHSEEEDDEEEENEKNDKTFTKPKRLVIVPSFTI